MRSLTPSETDQPMRNLVRDLAKFYMQVSTLPFEHIGTPQIVSKQDESSIQINASEIAIGPWLTYADVYRSAYPLGPFRTSRAAYTTMIDHVLGFIRDNKLGHDQPHEDQVLIYLAFLEARALIQDCPEMGEEGPTYLRHGDERGDAILVDEDGSLSAIIDWEL